MSSSCSSSSCDKNDDSTAAAALKKLSKYHPVVVEGMGWYDPRDPQEVASAIVKGLKQKTALQSKTSKPLLVISQGDPLAPKGISAITPLVSQAISRSERGLVCLDESIDASHSQNADRSNVVVEVQYSQLLKVLQNNNEIIVEQLENAIDKHIYNQNLERSKSNKPPIKDYFKTYAMLQEVTKAALKNLCGSITIAHTSSEINPFSVTSFYKVGLELDLYDEMDICSYENKTATERLDFETIDPRWKRRNETRNEKHRNKFAHRTRRLENWINHVYYF